jgi:1,4-alpha-glucan branching enzyme
LINISRYKLVLDSDAEEFGGHKRVSAGCEYIVDEMSYNGRPYSTLVSLGLNWFD